MEALKGLAKEMRASGKVSGLVTEAEARVFIVCAEMLEEAITGAEAELAALKSAAGADYKAAYEAAVAFIEESPCDPDITGKQWAAYEKYLEAKAEIAKHEAGPIPTPEGD